MNGSEFVALKEMILSKIGDLEKSIDHRFTALQGAIDIVREELDKRLKAIDDLRDQFQERGSTFATRESVQFMFESLDKRVTTLDDVMKVKTGEGKGISMTMGAVATIVTIMIALAGVVAVFLARGH